MKPRLIKFSCPSCGTRLAVPRHLAGVEDHCPKCGTVVASPVPREDPVPAVSQTVEPEPVPAPEPVVPPTQVELPPAPTPPEPMAIEPAPVEAPIEEAPSVESVMELPPPPLPSAPEVPDEAEESPAPTSDETEPEPEIHEHLPLPEAALPAPEVTARPELPAHVGERGTSLLESILRPSQAPLTTTLRPQGTSVAPKAATLTSEALPLPLRPVADEQLRPESDEPGMGEILEDHFIQSSVSGVIRHRAPGLGIDLIQMEDTPDSERRERRSRLALRGVLIFIVVDLCIAGWWGWGKLKKWWTYEPPVIHRAVPVGDAPIHDKESPPTPEELKPKEATVPAPTEPKEDKEAPKTSLNIPPVSQLVPPQNSMAGTPSTTGLAPQGPLDGSSAQSSSGSSPSTPPSPAPEAMPSGDKPDAIPSDGTSAIKPSAPLPVDVPKSPPSPPPAPTPGLKEALTDPPSLEPSNSGVVKAIPMDVASTTASTPLASGLPVGTPLKTDAPKVGETPSDRAQAAIVAKVGATFNPLEATTMPLTNEPLPETASPEVPEDAKTALKAAKAFLNAGSLSERLKWCQRATAVKREMERYYAKHPEGPVKFSSIDFMQRFPAKNSLPAYCMFEVKGPDFPHPVLLLVDQPAKKEAEVDWEAFVEFQGDALKKFFEAHVSDAKRFRVVMRRRHAFEKNVPDLDEKDSFEVSHPGADEIFTVYVVHKSEIGRELANKLPWNNDLPTIVELGWKKQGAQQWVEVRSVVAYGWKS